MKDRTTVLNLLTEFSNKHEDVSWNMKCTYADGMGTSINQINIIAQPDDRNIGVITYRIETGLVMICSYKDLKKPHSGNIVDMLLDMINYSKV